MAYLSLLALLFRVAERRTGITWKKMINESERIRLGHSSADKNEVYKTKKPPFNSEKSFPSSKLKRLISASKSS